jgi:hypothetical protein
MEHAAAEPLDVLIASRAKAFSDALNSAADRATKEEAIRVATERQLALIADAAHIKLEGSHEFTVASGFVDSVYDKVLIEYKNPSGAAKIGPKLDSPGSRKVVDQIKSRFQDLKNEHGQPLTSLLGVGLDGRRIVFVRFRDGDWHVQPPVPLDSDSASRFLWALFNAGIKGKPYSPRYLAEDFGSSASLARRGIKALYDVIISSPPPKAAAFFEQWKLLFSEVCGYDIDEPPPKIEEFAKTLGILSDPDSAALLFSIHTYYALFMKLLASEVVASFHGFPTPVQRLQAATNSSELKHELEALESGGVFRQIGVTNFLEGDLFSWYTDAWTPHVITLIKQMAAQLDLYNPGTLSEDPAASRDLLKHLYQQLLPRSVRHDLGEYYTPDWLAEHLLNEVGYAGAPADRVLDPACGSGTFLVLVINRIRRKWTAADPPPTADLLQTILNNVVGFDLNPLAVMAARTNYLIAIRDLVGKGAAVELPVYLCDTIETPAEQGDLFTGDHGSSRRLKTAVGPFYVPAEVATTRESVASYAEVLEFCVGNSYPLKEFLSKCASAGLPTTAVQLHSDLYRQLLELSRAKRNGVWARILKNSFAPVFLGKVNFVVGNPPWVNWEHLPAEYRDSLKPLWQHYGLFSLTGSEGRLGGGKKDISMLFTYVCVDKYLHEGGRLGFVITQTVFKSRGAGDGFRRFTYSLGDDRSQYLVPVQVQDLGRTQVFDGATNRTSLMILEKRPKPFQYPVPYKLWHGPSRIGQSVRLTDALELVTIEDQSAIPVARDKQTSAWLTAAPGALPAIRKLLGASDYTAYAGVFSGGLNGCYWLNIAKTVGKDILVENLHDVGKIKVQRVQVAIEPDLVYPLVRGRDVRRWVAAPSGYIILAQDATKGKGVPEAQMRSEQPKTFAYLKRFEGNPSRPARGTLRGRAMFKLYFNPSDPFYSMYNVGTYTLAKYKVMWRQFIPELRMAVVMPGRDKYLGAKVPITQHVVSFVAFETPAEAHYFAAMGNSSLATVLHWNSSTSKSYGQPHILTTLRIPRFDSKRLEHAQLAELGRECARIASSDGQAPEDLESQVDRVAASIWKVTAPELREARAALDRLRSSGSEDESEGDGD